MYLPCVKDRRLKGHPSNHLQVKLNKRLDGLDENNAKDYIFAKATASTNMSRRQHVISGLRACVITISQCMTCGELKKIAFTTVFEIHDPNFMTRKI